MRTRLSTDLDLPAELTWHHAAERFGENGEWTSLLTSSSVDRDEVGVGTTRECHNRDRVLAERLVSYDPAAMAFTYELVDPPTGVASARNTWTVDSVGVGRSRVSSSVAVELRWWATPLAPLLWLFNRAVIGRALEEFAHWAETGRPHPRKEAHSAKHARWRTNAARLETREAERSQVETSQTETGQVEASQVESGQVESGQAESGQVETSQTKTRQSEAR